MRIVGFETLLANAGLRNYLFVRLRTDDGTTGIGEATLEWQERTVQTLLHEWVESRVMGCDPFDVERLIGSMVRDQYQGGATVMTAISSVEIACWDLVGKACGQPVHRLLGGRCHRRLSAYANGWYGGCRTPQDFAERASQVVSSGYRALKLDPFGTAWKWPEEEETDLAVEIVAAVRRTVGDNIRIAVEFHGRLAATAAISQIGRLERLDPWWCEEPVTADSIELLREVRQRTRAPLAAGERLYALNDFHRLIGSRAVDIVQMDLAHCGGILAAKKIAGMAQAQDVAVAPHCSIGPVALAAALQFDWCTPNCLTQESFAEFDVVWRDELVHGWNPLRHGEFVPSDAPGLGLELDDTAIADHPYRPDAFPSLWDSSWSSGFTQRSMPLALAGTHRPKRDDDRGGSTSAPHRSEVDASPDQ